MVYRQVKYKLEQVAEVDSTMNLPTARSEPYKSEMLWWLKIKISIKHQLSRFPLIKTLVIRMWRTALKCKWRLLTISDAHKFGKVNVDKICWVSPERIVFSSLKEFSIYGFKGRVIGGNWDSLEKRFEHLDIFIAFKQVLIEGKDWTETIFYQRILDRLNKGEILWGCTDQNDLNQRCKDLQLLYQNIRRDGYKSQHEIMQIAGCFDSLRLDDEVIVSVGRHGDLLFSNSAHRLAIAKLLGVEKIPVKIAVRHPEWMRFRQELLLYAKDQGGRLYQPVLHPDLNDIPASHECEDRFVMIKEAMSAKQGRLLDIGANLGYFCHKFEDEGFECYAIESSLKVLYFLEKLKRAENRTFHIIGESVLECRKIRNMHFEVVLALNIFHHFLKTKETFHQLVELLKELQMDELFFEPHVPDELQMKGAYRNYTPDEFVEFVVQVSTLTNAELVGEAKDGRRIYRLY